MNKGFIGFILGIAFTYLIIDTAVKVWVIENV